MRDCRDHRPESIPYMRRDLRRKTERSELQRQGACASGSFFRGERLQEIEVAALMSLRYVIEKQFPVAALVVRWRLREFHQPPLHFVHWNCAIDAAVRNSERRFCA